MAIADYQQGVATKEIGVRVENVREQVPDYFFDDEAGFSFNGVTNIMTGTLRAGHRRRQRRWR